MDDEDLLALWENQPQDHGAEDVLVPGVQLRVRPRCQRGSQHLPEERETDTVSPTGLRSGESYATVPAHWEAQALDQPVAQSCGAASACWKGVTKQVRLRKLNASAG